MEESTVSLQIMPSSSIMKAYLLFQQYIPIKAHARVATQHMPCGLSDKDHQICCSMGNTIGTYTRHIINNKYTIPHEIMGVFTHVQTVDTRPLFPPPTLPGYEASSGQYRAQDSYCCHCVCYNGNIVHVPTEPFVLSSEPICG